MGIFLYKLFTSHLTMRDLSTVKFITFPCIYLVLAHWSTPSTPTQSNVVWRQPQTHSLCLYTCTDNFLPKYAELRRRHPPTKPIRQLKVKLSVFRDQRRIRISEQRNQVWLCPIHLEIGVGDVGRSRLPVLLISHLWSLTAPRGDIWKDNDKIVIFSNEVNSSYIAKFL